MEEFEKTEPELNQILRYLVSDGSCREMAQIRLEVWWARSTLKIGWLEKAVGGKSSRGHRSQDVLKRQASGDDSVDSSAVEPERSTVK